MKPVLPILIFVAIAFVGGSLLGASTGPDEWSDALVKPSFYPPEWLFAPVWAVLYILIGIAGGLVWNAAPRSPAVVAWFVQMAFNFAWTPVFFGAHLIGAALVVIAALLVSVIAFILLARNVNQTASLLFLPYLAWVSFATALNAALFVLN